MAGERRWNEKTILHAVQFDGEDTPTPRPVRLIGPPPNPGDPVRVGVSGAEVEGLIVELSFGVLHVRLAKLTMTKADARRRSSRKSAP